eukprot:gnl/Chilomastix_caulleri/5315.p2 GENE.gnl/Chilomastix_caulleri/5315~~gnl/Chilomastix_caulleri/5315.p2  ORF type:complete len:115 (+),score=35.63 gnl/Chilomastix_caulleri/5315:46-390(+)
MSFDAVVIDQLSPSGDSNSNIKKARSPVLGDGKIGKSRSVSHEAMPDLAQYRTDSGPISQTEFGSSHISIYQTNNQEVGSSGSNHPVITGYLYESGVSGYSNEYPGIYYPTIKE